MTAMFSVMRSPRRILSMVSTPRVEPIRHGVHLPQDSTAQNSIAKAGLLGHIDTVVEHDNPAMADQAVAGGEGLVVERRVEQFAREIGAERTADLHRAHRASSKGAAANIFDEFAQRDARRRSRTGRRI